MEEMMQLLTHIERDNLMLELVDKTTSSLHFTLQGRALPSLARLTLIRYEEGEQLLMLHNHQGVASYLMPHADPIGVMHHLGQWTSELGQRLLTLNQAALVAEQIRQNIPTTLTIAAEYDALAVLDEQTALPDQVDDIVAATAPLSIADCGVLAFAGVLDAERAPKAQYAPQLGLRLATLQPVLL
jgi:hypothetical protein